MSHYNQQSTLYSNVWHLSDITGPWDRFTPSIGQGRGPLDPSGKDSGIRSVVLIRCRLCRRQKPVDLLMTSDLESF